MNVKKPNNKKKLTTVPNPQQDQKKSNTDESKFRRYKSHEIYNNGQNPKKEERKKSDAIEIDLNTPEKTEHVSISISKSNYSYSKTQSENLSKTKSLGNFVSNNKKENSAKTTPYKGKNLHICETVNLMDDNSIVEVDSEDNCSPLSEKPVVLENIINKEDNAPKSFNIEENNNNPNKPHISFKNMNNNTPNFGNFGTRDVNDLNQQLLLFAERGNKEKVISILETPNVDVNYQDEKGNSALHYSCEEGNLKIVEYLLKKGINVNLKSKTKQTPLHLAAKHGYFDISKTLVEHGAEINALDVEKNLPIHLCAEIEHAELLSFFLDKFNGIDYKNNLGKTPMDLIKNEELKKTLKKYTKEKRNVTLIKISTAHRQQANALTKGFDKKNRLLSPKSVNSKYSSKTSSTGFQGSYTNQNRAKPKNVTYSSQSSSYAKYYHKTDTESERGYNKNKVVNTEISKPQTKDSKKNANDHNPSIKQILNNIFNSPGHKPKTANKNLEHKNSTSINKKNKPKEQMTAKSHKSLSKPKFGMTHFPTKNLRSTSTTQRTSSLQKHNILQHTTTSFPKYNQNIETSSVNNKNIDTTNFTEKTKAVDLSLEISQLPGSSKRVNNILNDTQQQVETNNLNASQMEDEKVNLTQNIINLVEKKRNKFQMDSKGNNNKNQKNKTDVKNKNIPGKNKTDRNSNNKPNISNVKNSNTKTKQNEKTNDIKTSNGNSPKTSSAKKSPNKNNQISSSINPNNMSMQQATSKIQLISASVMDTEDNQNNLENKKDENTVEIEEPSFSLINQTTPDKNITSMISASSSHLHSSSDSGEENKSKIEKIGPSSFICLGLLGEGSFGEVYLVQKIDTQEKFAMKVLDKERIMTQNIFKYAMAERNVLAITNHPFIVKLNYAFQTTEKLFLLLDYCPNGDLARQLEAQHHFSEEKAKFYLCEVILAIGDLHQKDIIFRDLKPDNVVLDDEGHALLTDFGLSREGVNDPKMAQSFCGSIAYLAPEMISRTGHGKSVDWYLIGVLFYEMLVGTPPFFNTNQKQIFRNISKGNLEIPPNISPKATDLIKQLLNKDPSARLGAKGDVEEVKRHPYFKDVNWDDVYNKVLPPPPIVDKRKPVQYYNEPRQFLDDEDYEKEREENGINTEDYEQKHKFEGWSFVQNMNNVNKTVPDNSDMFVEESQIENK